MEKEKKVFLLVLTGKDLEPMDSVEEYDINELPLIRTDVFESYESARKEADSIIDQYCSEALTYFSELKEYKEKKKQGIEVEDWEKPELDFCKFCTLEEKKRKYQRFLFTYGRNGHFMGVNGLMFKIEILAEKLLP